MLITVSGGPAFAFHTKREASPLAPPRLEDRAGDTIENDQAVVLIVTALFRVGRKAGKSSGGLCVYLPGRIGATERRLSPSGECRTGVRAPGVAGTPATRAGPWVGERTDPSFIRNCTEPG